jgi:nucleoside-diphosphate-sugar epimerase
MAKKLLICGASGFIGRNILEHYYNNEDYEITATYNEYSSLLDYDVEWVKADLNNPTHVQLAVKNKDIILQFAATTSGVKDIVNTPHVHVTDNAVMNSLLLREAYESGVEHFIFPSCTVMYQPSERALKENDFNPKKELLPNYFGVGNTKVYIEKMCEFYSKLGKTKHTVIRHSNIYGPHDKYDLEKSHVFGATVTKVMTSEDGKVHMWGTGEEKRDLLHIQDLIRFIDLAIEKQKKSYSLYNVGYGEAISISDLVKKIIELSGRDLEIVKDLSKPTIKTSLFLNCERAKKELGWHPSISLEEGIESTLKWYEENLL